MGDWRWGLGLGWFACWKATKGWWTECEELAPAKSDMASHQTYRLRTSHLTVIIHEQDWKGLLIWNGIL